MAQIKLYQNSDKISDRANQITALYSMSNYVRLELEKLQSPSFILAASLERCLADELATIRVKDFEQPMFEVRTSEF